MQFDKFQQFFASGLASWLVTTQPLPHWQIPISKSLSHFATTLQGEAFSCIPSAWQSQI